MKGSNAWLDKPCLVITQISIYFIKFLGCAKNILFNTN